jgi:hypothetical protein
MTRIVKFTFYIKKWIVDLTDILEDSEDPQRADAIQLFRLLDMESRTRSNKKLLPIRQEIFQLLNLELDVDFDCGKILSLPPESGSHNEMHNLVYGRISDEKDKGAVYAGI